MVLGGAHRAARVRRLERLERLERLQDALLQADRSRGKKNAFRAMVLQAVAGNTNQTRGEEMFVKRTNCWRVGDGCEVRGARCPSGMLLVDLGWRNDKRIQKIALLSIPSRCRPPKPICAFRVPVGVWERGRDLTQSEAIVGLHPCPVWLGRERTPTSKPHGAWGSPCVRKGHGSPAWPPSSPAALAGPGTPGT